MSTHFVTSMRCELGTPEYLQVAGGEPSPEHLALFSAAQCVPQPSRATMQDGTIWGPGRATGQPGIVYYISEVRWLERKIAQVEIGNYQLSTGEGHAWIYEIRRKPGRLVITLQASMPTP